ncbi:MAG: SRPBCC family protein [Acidimicrobiales bacterium]
MDVTASVRPEAAPEALFAVVGDLSRYPEWLSIVPRAVAVEAAHDDPGPAWSVDLRAAIGPLRRSKRLRMVRTDHDDPTGVRFERRERDGRSHSPWVLDARVDPSADGSDLTMHLHYGGSLWVPMLDRLLADEIERSRPRLLRLLGSDA